MWLFPALVCAHARPASLVHLAFDPGDPSRMVAQATWGLAISEDGGASFTWTCAAAFGVDARNEDPPIALTADGAVLLATFDGLVRGVPGVGVSDDDVCFYVG